MTTTIIITLCSLVLVAYLFDLSAKKTKIPSVILLLLLGWLLKQITNYLSIFIPDMHTALPVIGTVGLILIVLEGSLELELRASKKKMIINAVLMSVFPLLIMCFILAFMFQYYGSYSLRVSFLNAVPLSIISSAIAIPSVKSLTASTQEFVIYESSLSDIFGVLLFNFIALNAQIGANTFAEFFLQIILIIVGSLIVTVFLASMLNRIEHHIKFIPIILLVILLYAISKVYHLPGLIFILIFGLFLGNLRVLKRFKWLEKLQPEVLEKEVHKLRDLTVEGAFLIRSLFFLLFGYLIETSELLNSSTFLWVTGITFLIFVLRGVQLAISRLPFMPLLFIAPRGLITILLFLSIAPADTIPLVNNSLIIQVIVLTAIVMMIGLMVTKSDVKQPLENK
jgi:potassium/hydrogen antiporter